MFGAGEVGRPGGTDFAQHQHEVIEAQNCQVGGSDELDCQVTVEEHDGQGNWIQFQGPAECTLRGIDEDRDVNTYECIFRPTHTPNHSSEGARHARWMFGSETVLEEVKIAGGMTREAEELQEDRALKAKSFVTRATRRPDLFTVRDDMDGTCRSGRFSVQRGRQRITISREGSKRIVIIDDGDGRSVQEITPRQFARITKEIQEWRETR